MPWNQPGSGSDKDPWGQKNNQQGPPDLDQVIKDIKDKLGLSRGSSSGKNGSDGGSAGSGLPSKSLFFLIGIIALGFWAVSGFYTVTQGEQGIELQLGEYKRTTEAGLHWHVPSPIEKVQIINTFRENTVEVGYRSRAGGTQNSTVPLEALMLTEDENIIDIQFAVQYDIKSPTDLLFNVADPVETVVRQATESAVRETIGKNTMDFAITEGRAVIATDTRTLLQQILDRYQTGINVRTVKMQNAQPPAEVKDAFDDAVRAREDEQRLRNLAEAYANDIIPRARGKAARIAQEAEAYKASTIADAQGQASRFDQVREEYSKAPIVTRDRLYLDAMQTVLGSTSKMVIDQSQGGNSVMYLPLDKMIENSRNTTNAGSTSIPSARSNNAGSEGQTNRSSIGQGRAVNRSTIR